jgi:hypothetical protein
MKYILFAIVILTAVLPLAAQEKPEPPAPQLSELYQLKIENTNLRYQALQQQFDSSPPVQQVRSQYVGIMQEIEKAYPGYQYDPRLNRLVKLPPLQQPASAPAGPLPSPSTKASSAPVKK